jgi:hypothetical protein
MGSLSSVGVAASRHSNNIDMGCTLLLFFPMSASSSYLLVPEGYKPVHRRYSVASFVMLLVSRTKCIYRNIFC